MYAKVVDGEILTVGGLPRSANRLDNGDLILGFREYADRATREACGWFKVAETAKPFDTVDTVFESDVQLVDGTPTVVWVGRPKTAEELSAESSRNNETTIRQQALNALETNRTFIGLASPTNAQTLAQVKALSRQMNGLIRLLTGTLDGVD